MKTKMREQPQIEQGVKEEKRKPNSVSLLLLSPPYSIWRLSVAAVPDAVGVPRFSNEERDAAP
ncbi:MAG: hypothetical protein ABI579_08010, partial [Candidatus Sumerlaeota bacterium]